MLRGLGSKDGPRRPARAREYGDGLSPGVQAVLDVLVRILWGIEISRRAYIAPGAKLFGRIRIGDHVKIGANSVVHRDLPSNAVVDLSPGFQIVSLDGNRRGTPLQRAS